MKFTLWTLGLLALAAAVYFIRGRLNRRGDRKAYDLKSAVHKKSRAEADRRDIQNLVTRLHENNPDQEGEPIPAAGPTNGRGAQGDPRSRRSSEAPQGFDPDLPVPRTSRR